MWGLGTIIIPIPSLPSFPSLIPSMIFSPGFPRTMRNQQNPVIPFQPFSPMDWEALTTLDSARGAFSSPSKHQEIPLGWIHPQGRNVLGLVLLSTPFPTWIFAPLIPRRSSGSFSLAGNVLAAEIGDLLRSSGEGRSWNSLQSGLDLPKPGFSRFFSREEPNSCRIQEILDCQFLYQILPCPGTDPSLKCSGHIPGNKNSSGIFAWNAPWDHPSA